MCGICGIFSFCSSQRIDGVIIQKMMDSMEHRGPDDKGYCVEDRVALGHRRLSIIDLESGHQPIYNEDKTKCIVFNGEIYNYSELRQGLIGSGHTFLTRSDTEVILHLYEEKGTSCVKYLRGMFAFALWDKLKGILFIARDRMGIKPLYYTMTANSFLFASEIKSLLVTGLVEKNINYSSLDEYITLNYTLGPDTILKDVKKLMPGYFMTLKDDRLFLTEYWDFNNVVETEDLFEDSLIKLEELIEESIKMRLMSEVPLGAFLSGGVDSSVTVGVMSKLMEKPVKTFTVGYEEAEDVSELSYARIISKYFKTEHHEFVLKPKKFMDIASKVVWHLDEPIAEIATLPLLLLAELSKKFVTVMLSGEGVDEIFGGYPIYWYMNAIENYRRFPDILRRTLSNPIVKLLLRNKKEGKYSEWLNLPLNRRYLGNGSYFTEKTRNKLYSKDFNGFLNNNKLRRVIDSYYAKVKGQDALSKMLYLDAKTWLPEDLLVKADKMTMAASIELRVPFLDHKLVEFAFSLPSSAKVTMRHSKYIFKKYAEKVIPKKIVYRKKRGFPVPIKQWLRGELFSVVYDLLLSSKAKNRGFFDAKYIQKMLERHASGYEDLSKNIWNLVILELWMRSFIDESKS